MRVVTASPSTATAPPMVVAYINKVVHVLAYKTLTLNPTKPIAMAVDSIHKVAHALTCVAASLNAIALNTVVVFMPQVLVVVTFVAWTSVAIVQIAVYAKVQAPAMAPVVAYACSATPMSTSTTAASPRITQVCLAVACLSATHARVSAM